MTHAKRGSKHKGGSAGSRSSGVKRAQGGILRQERKIARKEVAKAGRIVRRKGQWSVAAEAMGYEAGYDGKEGFFARRRGGTVQAPSESRAMPASSSVMFRPSYKRRTTPNGDCIVTFCQKIADIASDGSSNNKAFVVGGTRTESIQISPDAFGGQIATDARNYGFYLFPKMKFIASMNAPSTDGQSVGMAYIPDAAIASFQTVSASSIQQCEDYVDFTRKELGPVVLVPRTLKKGKTSRYDTELDVGTSIATRNSVQGVVYGFFNANDALSVTYGQLFAVGECHLMDRTSDYGFTFSAGASLETLTEIQRCLVGLLRRADKRLDDQKITDQARRNEALMRVLPRYTSVLRHLSSEIKAASPGVYNPSIARVGIVDPSNTYMADVSTSGQLYSDSIVAVKALTFNPNGDFVGYKDVAAVSNSYHDGVNSTCSLATAPFVRSGTSTSASSLVSGVTGGPSGTTVNAGQAVMVGTNSTLSTGYTTADSSTATPVIPYGYATGDSKLHVLNVTTAGTTLVYTATACDVEKPQSCGSTSTSSAPIVPEIKDFEKGYVMVKPTPATLPASSAIKRGQTRCLLSQTTHDWSGISDEEFEYFFDSIDYGKSNNLPFKGKNPYTVDPASYHRWVKDGRPNVLSLTKPKK